MLTIPPAWWFISSWGNTTLRFHFLIQENGHQAEGLLWSLMWTHWKTTSPVKTAPAGTHLYLSALHQPLRAHFLVFVFCLIVMETAEKACVCVSVCARMCVCFDIYIICVNMNEFVITTCRRKWMKMSEFASLVGFSKMTKQDKGLCAVVGNFCDPRLPPDAQCKLQLPKALSVWAREKERGREREGEGVYLSHPDPLPFLWAPPPPQIKFIKSKTFHVQCF